MSDFTPGPTLDVVAEVVRERKRQDEKWGEQNHPDGTGPDVVWGITGPASWVAEQARGICDDQHREGFGTWLHIAREEIAEAFAEDEPAKLRAELVQSAAVLVQWIEHIDRRAGGAS